MRFTLNFMPSTSDVSGGVTGRVSNCWGSPERPTWRSGASWPPSSGCRLDNVRVGTGRSDVTSTSASKPRPPHYRDFPISRQPWPWSPRLAVESSLPCMARRCRVSEGDTDPGGRPVGSCRDGGIVPVPGEEAGWGGLGRARPPRSAHRSASRARSGLYGMVCRRTHGRTASDPGIRAGDVGMARSDCVWQASRSCSAQSLPRACSSAHRDVNVAGDWCGSRGARHPWSARRPEQTMNGTSASARSMCRPDRRGTGSLRSGRRLRLGSVLARAEPRLDRGLREGMGGRRC